MTVESNVICAWCGTRIASAPLVDPAAPTWYGICTACTDIGGGLFPRQNLHTFTESELDALPMGVLQLRGDGTVLAYNTAEEQLTGLDRSGVIGRNFFAEIAPCTRVQDFEGVFRDMVNDGQTARHAFDFVFRFAEGERFVHIAMTYDASEKKALILVQAASHNGPVAADGPLTPLAD